jgi:hypothetical protein
LRPKKHHSSRDISLPSTEARPPAEGNSRSRCIDRDCARESTRNPINKQMRIKWQEQSDG